MKVTVSSLSKKFKSIDWKCFYVHECVELNSYIARVYEKDGSVMELLIDPNNRIATAQMMSTRRLHKPFDISNWFENDWDK